MVSTSTISPGEPAAPVTLRGTQKGLEVLIEPGADLDEVLVGLRAKLEESPDFFAGNDVILRFLGEPLPGALGPLEALTSEFDLQIVSIRSPLEDRFQAARAALAVVSELAGGSAPVAEAEPEAMADIGHGHGHGHESRTTDHDHDHDHEAEHEHEHEHEAGPGAALDFAAAEIVLGPVRSGCVFESERHLLIFGDVNPGAEVRSAGAIVVLGRLRGVAHAGAAGVSAGEASPFILALELGPQQLRIGELVARAGDAEDPGAAPEIAHAAGDQIIVERYRGRLPRKLWPLLSR